MAVVKYPSNATLRLGGVDRIRQAVTSFRASAYAPFIVCWVLGAAICADLARASLLVLGRSPAKTQQPARVESPGTLPRGTIDVNGIVAAHLFGEAAKDPPLDPANAPPTSADLLLAGTLAMEDPKEGLAIISKDGRSLAYRVGDAVDDGQLHSVYRDHVLLRRRGILETLVFPQLQRTGESGGPPRAAVLATNEPGAPDSQQPDMPNAADVLRGSAWSAADGKLRGFRVFPSRNHRLFQQSGLRPGDLVVAVNGASLTDQDHMAGQQIFNSMKASSQATLTIERAGQRREVTLNAAEQDPSDPSEPLN